MAKIDESIEAAKKRLKQLQAQKQMQDAAKRAKASKEARAKDTRKKVLVGAMIMGQMEVSEQVRAGIIDGLGRYLKRADERALFDLPPLDVPPLEV